MKVGDRINRALQLFRQRKTRPQVADCFQQCRIGPEISFGPQLANLNKNSLSPEAMRAELLRDLIKMARIKGLKLVPLAPKEIESPTQKSYQPGELYARFKELVSLEVVDHERRGLNSLANFLGYELVPIEENSQGDNVVSFKK